MKYYKIPIINGVFDCPTGCVLCCAYPQGTDMICKFETCPEVGPGWVEITAEEFEANCPDFSQDLPVPESVAGQMIVTLDRENGVVDHSSMEIIAHLNDGGTAVLKNPTSDTTYGYIPFDSVVVDTVLFKGENVLRAAAVVYYLYTVHADKTFTMEEINVGAGSGATPAQAAQIQANADAIADIQDPVVSGNTAISGNTYTLTMPRDSGAVDTVVVEFDADGHVSKVNENGREIPWTTTGV